MSFDLMVEPAADATESESKSRTCLRTKDVKLVAGDESLARDLAATSRAIGMRAEALFRFLLACRGEAYREGETDVPAALALAARGDYLKGRSAAEWGPKLRAFYDAVLKQPHNVVISYVSPIYRTNSEIGQKTRLNRKTGLPNDVDPGKTIARELHAAGIFPILLDDLPHASYWRAAWTSAFEAAKMHAAAEALYRAETDRLAKRYADAEEVVAALPVPALAIWPQFVETAEKMGRRIDRRLTERWTGIRRRLLAGRPRDGEAELFDSVRPLWEGKRDLLGPFLRREAARISLANRPPTSRIPARDWNHHKIPLSVNGSNTVPVRLGSRDGAVEGEVLLIDADDPTQTRWRRINCMRSGYFLGLQMETVRQGATQVVVARYRRGRRVVKDQTRVHAVIKEPYLLPRGNDWHLYLVQNVVIEPRPDSLGASGKLWDQLGYFVAESPKIEAADVQHGMRALSVDLGVRPAIAWSLYELGEETTHPDDVAASGIGWANRCEVGIDGGIRSEDHASEINQLRARMGPLKSIIRFRGALLRGEDPATMHPRRIAACLRDFAAIGIRYTVDPVELRSWIWAEMCAVHSRFQRARSSEVRRAGVLTEAFAMAGLIRDYIALRKTWALNGPLRADRRLPQLDLNWGADLWRYYRNLKKDIIRKVASRIRRIAVECQADVVLVEDLKYFQQSVRQEKGTNSLLALWSAAEILDKIEQALEPHGIAMIRVDPRGTSRIDPRTGRYGYYDYRADKSVLVVDRDGVPEIIDADIAAAMNLQRRFWGRNSEVYRLDAVPDDTGAVLMASAAEDTEDGDTSVVGKPIGKRLVRFLRTQTGTTCARIEGKTLVACTPAARKKALSAALSRSDMDRYYCHADGWVPWEEHKRRLDALCGRLADQASESDRVRRYLARVKSVQAREFGQGGARQRA